MKTSLAFLPALVLATAPVATFAQTRSPSNPTAMNPGAEKSATDQDFVHSASISNLMEIQAGQLAEHMSRNSRIKSFAQELVQDHQGAQDDLKRRAGSLSVATSLDSEHQQMLSKLQNANTNFDRQFVQMQISAHQDAIQSYEDYVDESGNASLKRYAQNALPTLRNHLRTAMSLQSGSGAQAQNQQGSTTGAGQAVVTVRQGQPDVTVNQELPQIMVRQAAPHVTIELPQPEIIVRLPKPDVDVERNRPKVSVQMPKPRVDVVNQGGSADVEVNRATGEPQVKFQRSGEPQVTYRQAQGQPTVRYEDMNGDPIQGPAGNPQASNAMGQKDDDQTASLDANSRKLANSRAQAQSDEPDAMAMSRATAGDDESQRGGRRQQIRVGKLVDMSLYNAKGDNLGDVDQVVLNNDNNRRYLVLASGGFLGLFESKVAIPLERVRYEKGRLVIRGMTEDDIDDMQNWKRKIQHRRVLRDDDMASLVYASNG